MSSQIFESLHGDVEAFWQTLESAGWHDKPWGSASAKRSSADLFHQTAADRPLVVGLFGGTGVGKSSLLNRLAGGDVAKTGVVRPTSLEITAYLHESREISALPESFSVSNFNCVKHGNDNYRDVMWVDMPDFDSDETENRDQVLQWIPHIDLLIYVVTPERYKDEQGWRLLMEEGYRHGWLFVINQWDKAQDSQLDDFVSLLKGTGFLQPRVFRTVGIDRSSSIDEFDQLAQLVADLAERNAVEQLEQVGWFRRLEVAGQRLSEQQRILEFSSDNLVEMFDRRWEVVRQSVAINLDLPFVEYGAKFSDAEKSPLKNMVKVISGGGEEIKTPQVNSLIRSAGSLWDNWSQVKLKDTITEFELAGSEHGIPPRRLSRLRADPGEFLFQRIGETWSDQVMQAVTDPGPQWQRTLQRVLGWAKLVLPLAACGWIVVRVIRGFIDGASDPAAYVGLGFIANGALLVGLSWLLPWVAGYVSRPSVPKAVVKTLHEALQRDITHAREDYRKSLESLVRERVSLRSEARGLQEQIDSALSRSAVLKGEDVRDLLMHSTIKS